MTTDPPKHQRSWLTRRWLGLVILIAVCLPLTLWRAHLEESFWIDETYSIMLTTYPVPKLIALTASDAHPPGYYLALKAWNKSARVVGFEPGILWARSLNVAFWLLLAVAVWFVGRRLAGIRHGPLLAWGIAGNAYAASVAKDMRSYGVATVALTVCFLVLILLSKFAENDAPYVPRRIAALWGAYALAASVALWTHLLSALVLATLSTLWFLLFIRRRHLKGTFLAGMVTAHSLAVLGFFPWLFRIREQWAYLEGSDPEWMTPPTVENLFRVFTFWFPYGRIGYPEMFAESAVVPLGIAAVVIPFLIWLWAVMSPGTPSISSSFFDRAAALGIGSAVVFVTALWLLDRWDMTHTFHGPRYPALAIHLWAGGLAFLVIGAAWRRRWDGWRMALSIVPWLICAAVGQGISAQAEARWGLEAWREQLASFFPLKDGVIYVMPSELLPFYRKTFQDFDMKPIENLPCEAKSKAAVTVLNVNFWSSIDRARDHIVRYLINNSILAEHVARRSFPERQGDYTVYRLEGMDSSKLEEICRTGLSSHLARELSHIGTKALAEDQVSGAYWSFLEIDQDLRASRWATSALTPIIFDQGLGKGEYILHFQGYRSEYPRDPLSMRIVLQQDPDRLDHRIDVGSGPFHLRLPVEFDAALRHPILLVEHATWSPSEVGMSSDTRRCGHGERSARSCRAREAGEVASGSARCPGSHR